MKRLAPLFAFAFGGGLTCSQPTHPTQEVRISVAGDSIAATVVHINSGDYLQFDLKVTIDNRSTATVAYEPCSFAIEGSTAAGWTRVWGSTCFRPGVDYPRLTPRETRELTFTVHAALGDPGIGEKWNSPSHSGTYRFRAVAYAIDGTTVTVIPSNAFVVRASE